MSFNMEGKTRAAYNILERMLHDENEKPSMLPLSLLKEITNDFSNEQELGNGGFAVVYKVRIHQLLLLRLILIKIYSKDQLGKFLIG